MARGELQSCIAENQVHRQTMKIGDKQDPLAKIKACHRDSKEYFGEKNWAKWNWVGRNY